MMRRIAVFAMALALAGCSAQGAGRSHALYGGDSYSASIHKKSEKGSYSVTIVIGGGGLTVGNNSMDIIVHDMAGSSVSGADVTLTPWMPEHGHGVSVEPVITERGGGLYSIDNVLANMAGRWEFIIGITSDGVEDTVLIDVPNLRKAHGGELGISMDESGVTKVSSGGDFSVSYASLTGTLPVNTAHTWRLRVSTPEGAPVEGAEIEAEGYMPGHGHGMPVRPRVTDGKEPGTYFVEGMKFNMPDIWAVTFRIHAGSFRDTVTFWLNLR